MRRRLLSLLAAPGVLDRTWHRRARGSAGRPTRRRPRSRVLRARNSVVALAADEYRVHRRRGRRRVVPREAFARHRSSRGNELFHRLPLFERITAPGISASFPAPGAAVARASRVDVRDVDAEHSAGTTTTRARQRRRVRRRVRRPRARVVQKYTKPSAVVAVKRSVLRCIARLPEYSAEYSAVVGGGRVGKRPGRRIRRHSTCRRVDKVADVLKTAVDTRHRQKMHRQKKRRRTRAARVFPRMSTFNRCADAGSRVGRVSPSLRASRSLTTCPRKTYPYRP